jgi:hypothetical protein
VKGGFLQQHHQPVTRRYVRAATEKQLPETPLRSLDRFDNMRRLFCSSLFDGRKTASFGATTNLRSFLSHWIFLSWQVGFEGGRSPAHH